MQTPTTKRRRTIYSRERAPLGTVRLRQTGERGDKLARMIKVKLDGPPQRRWMEYGRWLWERRHGPVPAGKRIYHADGDLLNDDPANLVALTPGEGLRLMHQRDPEMSRRSHAGCGRAAARRNVETARQRRASGWLASQWYPVDFTNRVIHNAPRRKRWQVYRDRGLADRLAERLRLEVAAARAGDAAAAAFVMRSASTFRTYWRFVRPAALGWPGINCMGACVLAVLLDAPGGRLTTSALLARVKSMREDFGWRRHTLHKGVLFSLASQMREFFHSTRDGRREATWSITAAAIAARVDGPRVIAIRGRRLAEPRFAEFRRVDVDGYTPERRTAERRGAA